MVGRSFLFLFPSTPPCGTSSTNKEEEEEEEEEHTKEAGTRATASPRTSCSKKKGKGKHDAIPSNRDFEKEGAYSSFRLLMDELIVLDKLFMHAVSLGNATFPSRCPAHLASCYRKEKNLRKSFIVGRACRFFVTAGPGRLLTSLNLDFCSVLYYILLYY